MRITAAIFAAVSLSCHGSDVIKISGKAQIPPPAEMSVTVETSGRTSVLKSVDIAEITSQAIPDTFSDSLIHNSSGFIWYVSRHFAVKTNLPRNDAAEALALLETAWPQYTAVFGRTPPGMDFRRLAVVLASDRNSLERAMTDDDMHVLNLGGITQEGFSCAYLYAGISYQTRYILLHEATHLFQYCISGNTRSCYGFFVEGVADFFSSHVFDKATHSLTVNVLDRAPIHNHLAAGMEEWQRLGQPPFSDLYENHRGSRGLDVIMTAFLQSTPEFERNWLTYCSEIAANADAAKAKPLSDRLLHSLYGNFSALDKAFSDWMNGLTPSFLTGIREFDQNGDTFISVYAPSETTPATLTLTNPGLTVSDFVLDWPHSDKTVDEDTNTFFSVEISLPPAEQTPVVAGLRFYSREMRQLKTAAITNSKPRKVSARLSFSAEELAAPSAPAASCIAEMFASVPGVSFTPVSFPAAKENSDFKKAAGCRFLSTASLPQLLAVAEILGDKTPQQLRIAIEALKSPSPLKLVLPEDTETEEFWQALADEIAAAKVDNETRNKALCSLSGIVVSVSKIHGDRLLVELQNAFPAPGKADAALWSDFGKTSSSGGNGTTIFFFKDPQTAIRASVNVKWLGHTLKFEKEYDGGKAITDWKILGPFRLSGDFKNATLPPDTYPLDLDKVFTAEDGSRIFWKDATVCGGGQNTPPLLHFAKEFGRQANNSAAYAYTEIDCAEKGTYELILGVTDGVSIWNNSIPVLTDMHKREWADGNLRIPVTLKKGTNKLLSKLVHSTGVWFLSARIRPAGKK